MGFLTPVLADWKHAALLSLGILACAETPQERPLTILGRVGEKEISERDFIQALERLPAGAQDKTLDDWQNQFQVLIDKELLLFEARAQELDQVVAAAVEAWERNQLVDELLAREMSEALTWTETELAAFFTESGAEREIRLNRLSLVRKEQALEALKKARDGMSFAALAENYGRTTWSQSGWLNVLNAGDQRLATLFLLPAGAVELIEADGQYLVLGIADERQASFATRRPLAEAALERRNKQQANLAYLEHLTGKYSVRLDTAGLRRVVGGKAEPDLRLVSSSLGDWSLSDYQQALVRLRAGDEARSTEVGALGFKVTRAFVADRLLEEEAKKHGLYPELETRREKMREQKMIKALWDREIFAKVQIDPAELSAFYEANKERYSSLGDNKEALQKKVVQDLRDTRAMPLFDRYIEDLRQKHAAIVSVDTNLLREFVSSRRQAASPVNL